MLAPRCLMKKLRIKILKKESLMTEKTGSIPDAGMKMTSI